MTIQSSERKTGNLFKKNYIKYFFSRQFSKIFVNWSSWMICYQNHYCENTYNLLNFIVGKYIFIFILLRDINHSLFLYDRYNNYIFYSICLKRAPLVLSTTVVVKNHSPRNGQKSWCFRGHHVAKLLCTPLLLSQGV